MGRPLRRDTGNRLAGRAGPGIVVRSLSHSGYTSMQLRFTLLAVALLAATVAPTARADGPAGNWKYRFSEGETSITMLLMFSESEKKWVGDYIGASLPIRVEPKITSLAVTGDTVTFTLEIGGREFLNFDGALAKDGKKLVGSASQAGGPLKLVELYPSKLKKLTDTFELAREDFAQQEDGAALFESGFTLAAKAAEKKLKVEEARGIADKLAKAATNYGPRWERTVAVRLADIFAEQEGFADVALAQARRAERMLAETDPAVMQMGVYETLAKVLAKSGKPDEAKKYAGMLAKLEARDAAEYEKAMMKFETAEYKGRKAKSDRIALVEVFTGAECPPCVAVDVAFDGLLKTYKPTDVLFLQYHFHVPAPDPLTSAESMERAEHYGEKITGAPTFFLNGKPVGRGGGGAPAAKGKYAEFREAIDGELEKATTAKIVLTAMKDDKGYAIKAAVSDLEKPGEKVMLRFALVEERVRYTGGNGVRYHQQVVRAMPGGTKGFALTKKALDQSVTVNVDEVKGKLAKYLDEFAKNESPFPRADRPLSLEKLKLVAFIQDDATGEVLNAAQVELGAK